jgi:hypothetical protein
VSRGAGQTRRQLKIALVLVMLAAAARVEARTVETSGRPVGPRTPPRRTAGEPALRSRAEVAITVITDDGCAAQLQAVIAEQLAGLATAVTWRCAGRPDEDEPFQAAAASAGGVQLWIDVSRAGEARLTVRDHEDRFVVRRLPLASGLDEVGREEIGQIVRSAVLAVLASPSETLTRAEARAAVSSWPAPPAPTRPEKTAVQDRGRSGAAAPPRSTPAALAGSRTTLDVGAAAALRAFSGKIPVVGEIGIVASVGGSWPLSLWAEAAYRIPATELEPTVGVEVRALSLRGGLAVSSRRSGRVGFRAGAGGGIERTSFSPKATGGQVDLAPGGSFLVFTGRALVGIELRAAAHLGVGLTAFCDAETTNVHYDLHAPDGTAHSVLTPFRLQPGITLSVSGWFGH